MKLFYATGSSSLFPHIVLQETGLPFEAIKIDEHTKEWSALGMSNPRGFNLISAAIAEFEKACFQDQKSGPLAFALPHQSEQPR